MSIIHTEALGENVEPPMKNAEFMELIEQLRVTQEKASELASHQLDLTKQLEAAFKVARDLHQKNVAGQTEVGGEG